MEQSCEFNRALSAANDDHSFSLEALEFAVLAGMRDDGRWETVVLCRSVSVVMQTRGHDHRGRVELAPILERQAKVALAPRDRRDVRLLDLRHHPALEPQPIIDERLDR